MRVYHPRDTLYKLGIIRRLIEEFNVLERNLLLTVFGNVVEKYSYLRRTPAPEFSPSKFPERDPIEYYIEKLREAISDLRNHAFNGCVEVVWSDSTVWLPRRVCCLLTSPPFANNVDYIRHTQLQLLWSGLARDSNDLGYLRSLQIPACVAAARSWKKEYLDGDLIKIINRIGSGRVKDYRKYLKQYFYYMKKHFELLYDRLEGEAWYTIGDSFLGGTYIPTHNLLKKIADAIGFKTEISKIGLRKHLNKELGLYLLKLFSKR